MTELLAEDTAANLADAPPIAGLSLSVANPDALILLGGSAADAAFAAAVKKALKVNLPKPGAQSGSDPLLVWQGYERWLIYCHSDGDAILASLPKAFGEAAPLSEVTDGSFVVQIQGPKLRDLLAMGSSTDCSPTALPAGSSAVLRFAELPALLIVTGNESALLLMERASKDYVWRWLGRAASALD